jgi:hypothetical protein
MKELRYTLLTDGSADRALTPILTWLLKKKAEWAIQESWADLRRLSRPPKKLHERILRSLELYPCDLLFVHRDAENASLQTRIQEIQDALASAGKVKSLPPAICVVPVRMQEAWLLFDEAAIRRAANNPNGRQQLDLPAVAKCEMLSDPKDDLHNALRNATGFTGRRRHKFDSHAAALRLADLIDDFSPLRILPPFQHLEMQLTQLIQSQHWGK